MPSGKFASYLRVSTQRQGRSGLGLEAQRAAVAAYLNGGDWSLVREFTEVETGKGSDALGKRPELRSALAVARSEGATLIIAKLDRLARNVHFVSGLLESGVEFVAADMPEANKVMIQIYSVMAEWERDQISARTKAALRAARARGVRLGTAGATNLHPTTLARQEAAVAFARRLSGVIEGFRKSGLSQRQIVGQLNDLGVQTPKGGRWSLVQLQRVIRRLSTAGLM
jgi:DNA invertase Pin-like site-specific DNA recombinase